MIETVLGPVAEDRIKGCLPHEHLSVFGPNEASIPVMEQLVGDIVPSLKRLVSEHDCNTLVECTCTTCYGRDVRGYAELARLSGMHVMASTGFYVEQQNPFWMKEANESDLEAFWIREIRDGMDGTDIKPGILKASFDKRRCGDAAHLERSRRWHGALARVHAETGLPVTCHCNAPHAATQLAWLKEDGVSPSALAFGHMDAQGEEKLLWPILDAGAFAMFTFCACADPGSFDRDIKLIKAAIDRGYVLQLMLSVDMMPKVEGRKGRVETHSYGQDFTDIHERAVPALLELGVTRDVIHAMTRDNPRRHLTGGAA